MKQALFPAFLILLFAYTLWKYPADKNDSCDRIEVTFILISGHQFKTLVAVPAGSNLKIYTEKGSYWLVAVPPHGRRHIELIPGAVYILRYERISKAQPNNDEKEKII